MNRMDRRSFLALASALPACTRRPALGSRKLTVGLGSFLSMSPFYLAQERGYFHDAGFEIVTQVTRSSTAGLPLLAQGALDVGFYGSTAGLVNLFAQGARVRIAAAREIMSQCGDSAVLYENKSRFKGGDTSAEAWLGKRVAQQTRGAPADFAFWRFLQHAGVPASGVKRIYTERSAELAALLSGGVDAMVNGFAIPLNFGERQAEFQRNDAPVRLVDGMQYTYVLFSKSLLDADPHIGADFLRAYFRGTREYLAGATPQFFTRWVSDNGLDAQTVAAMCRNTFQADGSVRVDDLQTYLDWLVEEGLAQKTSAVGLVDIRSLNLAHKASA